MVPSVSASATRRTRPAGAARKGTAGPASPNRHRFASGRCRRSWVTRSISSAVLRQPFRAARPELPNSFREAPRPPRRSAPAGRPAALPASSVARQHTQQVVLGQAGEFAGSARGSELLGDRIQPDADGDGGEIPYPLFCQPAPTLFVVFYVGGWRICRWGTRFRCRRARVGISPRAGRLPCGIPSRRCRACGGGTSTTRSRYRYEWAHHGRPDHVVDFGEDAGHGAARGAALPIPQDDRLALLGGEDPLPRTQLKDSPVLIEHDFLYPAGAGELPYRRHRDRGLPDKPATLARIPGFLG